MTATQTEQHVAVLELTCDQCGKQVTVTQVADENTLVDRIENGGVEVPLPEGWFAFRNPDLNQQTMLHFHTQRCAIGWFRVLVLGEEKAQTKPRAVDREA